MWYPTHSLSVWETQRAYVPLLFNLYHYLEQILLFGLVPQNQFLSSVVDTNGQVRHRPCSNKIFVRLSREVKSGNGPQ